MYQIPRLLKYKNLFHAFSEISDGNMANAIGGVVYRFSDVIINRKMFLNKAGIDINRSVCMKVIHGDKIVDADPKLAGVSMFDHKKAVKVDGLMTNNKGLYLFLLIADCLPIIIYDPVTEAVGLIHAGWRGVDLEIAKKGVEKFKSKYRSPAERGPAPQDKLWSDPKNLIVAIGPCARKESFIKENPSQLNDPRWKEYITACHPDPELAEGEGSQRILHGVYTECKRSVQNDNVRDYYMVDLVGFTKKQLLDAGIKKENIIDCGIDTVKDKRFFSHVRDCNNHISRQGRFACVVGLK